jgi:formylglycine-generating enzyme required for sulfatase activity
VDYDRANPFGLHGIHGNVAEWVRDRYGSYKLTARAGDGERSVLVSSQRVFRGGSITETVASVRCSHRFDSVPENASETRGVRPGRILER